MLIAFVLGLVSLIVLRLSPLRLAMNVLIVAGITILSIVAERILNWGSGDLEGLGWVMLFTLWGCGFMWLFVIIAAFLDTRARWKERLVSVLIYPLAMAGYLLYFSELGMVYVNNATEKMTVSKRKGLYIADLSYEEKLIVHGKDTFKLGSGWMERETRFNHTGIVKRTEEYTLGYKYVVPIRGVFDQHGYNTSVYYQVNRVDVNGAAPIDSVLVIDVEPGRTNMDLYFFAQDSNGFNFLKRINVSPIK